MDKNLLQRINEKVNSENMVFKAEDIVVLSNTYNNTLKFAFVYNKGEFEKTPVAYLVGDEKLSESFDVERGRTYIEHDFIVEGSLSQVLSEVKNNLKNKEIKNNKDKVFVDCFADFPMITNLVAKEKFTKSELLMTERRFNGFVKDLNKKAAFEL